MSSPVDDNHQQQPQLSPRSAANDTALAPTLIAEQSIVAVVVVVVGCVHPIPLPARWLMRWIEGEKWFIFLCLITSICSGQPPTADRANKGQQVAAPPFDLFKLPPLNLTKSAHYSRMSKFSARPPAHCGPGTHPRKLLEPIPSLIRAPHWIMMILMMMLMIHIVQVNQCDFSGTEVRKFAARSSN